VQQLGNEAYVAQKYIDSPLLIDGLKFDLWIYVLVYGVDPLRVYLFREGIGRFATEEYEKPQGKNMWNLFKHLTNYAINKDNENFYCNDESDGDEGHKWTLSSVLSTLEQMGFDTNLLMN